jgi:D-alanyl-D-alanine carboxypeptidase
VVPAGADARLLVDVDSGKVISEQNSTHPWYPASVTKLMTTYVTLKAVRDRLIELDSVFTVSPNAVAQNPFKMGFRVGTAVTVDNALKSCWCVRRTTLRWCWPKACPDRSKSSPTK